MKLPLFITVVAGSSLEDLAFESLSNSLKTNVINAATKLGPFAINTPGLKEELMLARSLNLDMSPDQFLGSFLDSNRPCFYDALPEQIRGRYFDFFSEDLSLDVTPLESSIPTADVSVIHLRNLQYDRSKFRFSEISQQVTILDPQVGRFVELVGADPKTPPSLNLKQRIYVDLKKKCAAKASAAVVGFLPSRSVVAVKGREAQRVPLMSTSNQYSYRNRFVVMNEPAAIGVDYVSVFSPAGEKRFSPEGCLRLLQNEPRPAFPMVAAFAVIRLQETPQGYLLFLEEDFSQFKNLRNLVGVDGFLGVFFNRAHRIIHRSLDYISPPTQTPSDDWRSSVRNYETYGQQPHLLSVRSSSGRYNWQGAIDALAATSMTVIVGAPITEDATTSSVAFVNLPGIRRI